MIQTSQVLHVDVLKNMLGEVSYAIGLNPRCCIFLYSRTQAIRIW